MQLEASIAKNFKNFSLEADITVNSQCCGVFGPSGSEKSTLMYLLSGLHRPDSGRIELSGQVLFDSVLKIDLPPEERRVGVVFQHSHLFPHLNVQNGNPRRVRRDYSYQGLGSAQAVLMLKQ